MADDDEAADATHRARIKVIRNGPYVVTGNLPLSRQTIDCDEEGMPIGWNPGEEFPTMETYALCRCGRSRNKPYCDGAHARAGFDGTETAGREEYLEHPEKTEGPALVLWDVEKLCAVALFCHRAGDAWNNTEHSDDPKCREIAIQEARDCPSGRLVACDRKTGRPFEPGFEKSIGLVMGPQKGVEGPLWVRGGVVVESADGKTYRTRNRVTLCRCGTSANKPFCDGSHRKAPLRTEVP